MRYEVPGTLAYYLSAPQFKLMKADQVSTPTVAKHCAVYKSKANQALPDAQAVEFYALNQLSTLIVQKYTPYEQLPDWANKVMTRYLEAVVSQTPRVMYYLALICTREQRHLPGQTTEWWNDMNSKYGQAFKTFATGIPGQESQAVQRFMSDPPLMPITAWSQAMADCFFKGKSWGSSYGGKKWGVIADCLTRFLKGETTAEIMCDTAYTLAHNGGPMFNKGMLYGMYTHELYKILDVQRSGQVAELLMQGGTPDVHGVIPYIWLVQEQLGTVSDFVDWKRVDEAGALHGPYFNTLKSGAKPGKTGLGGSAKTVTQPEKPPEWLAKGETLVGKWVVTPKEYVIQYKRAA